MTLQMIRSEERAEGREEGREEGQTLLVSAIQRLRAGETRETLLSEGYDNKTIELAYACR